MRRGETFRGSVAERYARLGADIDENAFLAGELEIVVDHHGDQSSEIDLLAPAETSPRPGRVTLENINFRRSEVARIDRDMALPVDIGAARRDLQELLHGMAFSGSDDVVVRALLYRVHVHEFPTSFHGQAN